MKTIADFLNAGNKEGKSCPIKITDEFWMGQLNILFHQLREQEKELERLKTRPFRRARTAV